MYIGNLTILNALIFDGESDALKPGNITIKDGYIEAVGEQPTGPDDAAPDDRVIDAGGRTVIPGLIDAHFHAYASDIDGAVTAASPLSYVALMAASRLTAALGRGFTTVRDVAGGDPGLANAITEGLFPSPRYFYTGAALSQTGGHGDFSSGDFDVCGAHDHACEVVDGVDDIRRAVRERFRRGAHAIKIMASGGVISPSDPLRIPQYSPEEIQMACAEASRRGSYVCAHAYTAEAVVHAVSNGVRSIEHGNLIDAAAAELMATAGAFLVPTLVAYDAMNRRGDEIGLSATAKAKNDEVLHAGKLAVGLARAAGVQIGFGSDLMGNLADEQLLGLKLQIQADSVLGVLKSVTSVNAQLLQLDDRGRIATGLRGDLVILDGNPESDPGALWDEARPRTVVLGGVVQ